MKCCKNPNTVRQDDGTLRCLNCGFQTLTTAVVAAQRAERVTAVFQSRFGAALDVTIVNDRISIDLIPLRHLIEAVIASPSAGLKFGSALSSAIKS